MILSTFVKALVISLLFGGLFWLIKKIRGDKEFKNQGPDEKENRFIDRGFGVSLGGLSRSKTKAFWASKEGTEAVQRYLHFQYLNDGDWYKTGKKIKEILDYYKTEDATKLISNLATEAEKEYLKKPQQNRP